MTSTQRYLRCAVAVAIALMARDAAAQTIEFLTGDAALGPIVRGVPYSGDGETNLAQTLGDGTRIERTAKSKFYRDSAGRVRREQTIIGLAALNPQSESRMLVTIVDPVAGVTFTLDPATRVARRAPLDKRVLAGTPPPPPPPPPPGGAGTAAPPPPPPPPAKPDEESLGIREIAGVRAIGRRTRVTIPVGQIGNDRPIVITSERWESAELKVLVWSRHHDPRTGDVEFRLTHLRRADPPGEMFTVPAEYTVIDAPRHSR
jgi:hypothetical protein